MIAALHWDTLRMMAYMTGTGLVVWGLPLLYEKGVSVRRWLFRHKRQQTKVVLDVDRYGEIAPVVRRQYGSFLEYNALMNEDVGEYVDGDEDVAIVEGVTVGRDSESFLLPYEEQRTLSLNRTNDDLNLLDLEKCWRCADPVPRDDDLGLCAPCVQALKEA